MPLSRVDKLNMQDKLRQDIKDACKQLETFGEESLVLFVYGDVVSTLGSTIGLQFLQWSSTVKSDFKKHCNRNPRSVNNDANYQLEAAAVKDETADHPNVLSDGPPDMPSPTCSDASDDDNQESKDSVDVSLGGTSSKQNVNGSKSHKHKREKNVDNDTTEVKKLNETPRRSIRKKTPKGGKENKGINKVPILKITLKKTGVDNVKTALPEVKSEVDNYLCHICQKKFSVRSEFNEHLKMHKVLACHICKTVFKTEEKMHAHKLTHQEKDEWQECDVCKKAFKDRILLEEHILNIHKNDKQTQFQSYMDNIDAHINYLDNETKEEKRTTLKQMISDAKPPYECPICRKSFDKRIFNLRRHLLRHSTEPLFPCRACDRVFRSMETLRRHFTVHDLQQFKCGKCGRGYVTQELLDEHSRFVCAPGEKPYIPCDLCDTKWNSILSFEKHQKQHSGVKEFECGQCGKRLASKESLERHKLVQHGTETPWQCDVCDKRFKIRDTLRKHQRTHQDPKYHCAICQKGCTEWGNLKKHMQTHTKDKDYVCDACGKTYGRKSLLDNHQRLHTGEKPFVCNVQNCGKQFRSYANLKQHKATHSTAREHVCDFCGKGFKTRGRMNHHRKFHTVDYRWPCEYCEEKFRSMFVYKSHLAKMHPECKDDMERKHNIRLYQCDLCNKIYGDKEDLTRHYYIHSGLKPFKCDHCGKAFNDKSNLRQHEKIHTGEKLNRCGRCYKSFIHLRSLKLHMKNVHNYTEVGDDGADIFKADEDMVVDNNQGPVPVMCIQALHDCGSQTETHHRPPGRRPTGADVEHQVVAHHMLQIQQEIPVATTDMELEDPERQAVIQDVHGLQSEMQGHMLQELGRPLQPLLLPLAMSSHSQLTTHPQLTTHTELTSLQHYPGPELISPEPQALQIVENF